LNPRKESVEDRCPSTRPQGGQADTAKSRLMSDQNEIKPAPALGPDIRATIGRELRRMYAEVIAEGVPERFAEILRKLDEPSNEDSKNDPTPPTI
jgi:Anti-sigma factor NepR